MQNWLFDIRSRSFVLLVVLFLILTAIVNFGITESFDQNIMLFFSENVGNSSLDLFMQYVNESGDVFNMLIFGIILLIIPKTRRIGITLMILLVLATLATSIISGVLSMAGGMILMGVFGFFLSEPAAMVLHGIAQTFSNGSRVWLYRRHIK